MAHAAFRWLVTAGAVALAGGVCAETPVAGRAGTAPTAQNAPASSTTASGVVVEYAAPMLTLHISQKTGLIAVLDVVCATVDARCEVAEGVHSAVAPMTLSGTWIEVATALLQTAGLSYAVTPAGRGVPAHLIVEDTLAGPAGPPVPVSRAEGRGPQVRGAGGVLVRVPEAADAEEPPFAEPALDPDVAASMGLTSTGVPFPGPAGTAVFVTAPTEGATASAPFPDANGNAFVPTRAPADSGSAGVGPVSPFPDAFGNPIRTPAGTVAQPFTTPFPDGHGGAITMPPPPAAPAPPTAGH